MGTKDESKTRIARTQKQCVRCGNAILRGDVYYEYRPGQRTRLPYCELCASALALPNAPAERRPQ